MELPTVGAYSSNELDYIRGIEFLSVEFESAATLGATELELEA